MAKRTFRDADVLVTGASSGIGRALAVQLAAADVSRLLLTARREDRLIELRDLLSQDHPHCRCEIVAGDLTDEDVRESLRQRVEAWGKLDVLIHNAGRGGIGPFAESDSTRLREIMELNFFAPVELTRALLPLLKAGRKPALACVGSVLALAAVPLKSEYCASKFALHGWAESLRPEVAAAGIDVVEIHPSTTNSEFFDSVLGDASAQRSVGAMSVEQAAGYVLRAVRAGRVESIVPIAGKALVALRRWLPPVYRWLMRRPSADG